MLTQLDTDGAIVVIGRVNINNVGLDYLTNRALVYSNDVAARRHEG